MSKHDSRVLSARWIFPVTSPPIHGGWIRIVDGRIAEVKRGTPPAAAVDLGDVAILPRLVNAHTHLEFSDLQQPIGQPGIPLATWIGLVIASRVATPREAKQRAIDRGLREMWSTGTLLAGEIMTPPTDYPPVDSRPHLKLFSEVLGLTPDRASERLTAAETHLQAHAHGACSPHAPYSVSPELLEATVQLACKYQRAIAMHVAESPEERELLVNGSGPLAEALQSLGVWRDNLFPWGRDPFCELVDSLSAANSVLLVHGNQLNHREIEYVARFQNLTVVYCPRTHHYFQFGSHPVSHMLQQGIRVALGTDSRASNPDLNLWKEVQHLLGYRQDLNPAEVIRMASWNGAVALGYPGEGAIQAGASAELGLVPTEASSLDPLYRDFCSHDYRPLESEERETS